MASVKNITPVPTERTFEVTLTDQEIKDITEVATRLHSHRSLVSRNAGIPRLRFENVLGLLFALNPEDPLDHVETDDIFLLKTQAMRHG